MTSLKFKYSFNTPPVMFLLGLVSMFTSCNSKYDKKWISLPHEFRPSLALLNAQKLWNTSLQVEETLKYRFSMEEYEKRQKVEEEGQRLLKDLQTMEYDVGKFIEVIKELGGLKTLEIRAKYLAKTKHYDKLVEDSIRLVNEIKAVVQSNSEDGSKLIEHLVKFKNFVKEMLNIYSILSEVGIKLKSESHSENSSEATDEDSSNFDIGVLWLLKEYFSLIDEIEDKINNVLSQEDILLDEKGDKITNEEEIIAIGTKSRYDIYQNKIKPLVKESSEMLMNFDTRMVARLARIKTLSSGKLFNSFEELAIRLEKLQEELAEADLKILAVSLEFKKFDSDLTLKDVQAQNTVLQKNYTNLSDMNHEEL